MRSCERRAPVREAAAEFARAVPQHKCLVVELPSTDLGISIAEAYNIGRDLANCPAATLAAARMAELATELGARGGFAVEVFDNMPSGWAMKPGDVLTMRNGTTVEVLNTDAEGRLVMADGLALAVEKPAYRRQLDSVIADMTNMGGPDAGSITAALFLEEFVNGHPWAHIDIAGTAQLPAPRAWRNKGATGAGGMLLIELAMSFRPPSAEPRSRSSSS
jgi:leucyl aminopeptidase